MTPPIGTKDSQTVNAQSVSLAPVPHGVRFREAPTHVDARGSLVEIFDPRWNWHPDPIVQVYACTLRPGYVKGWAMHKLHEDRYFVLAGEMEVVMYDDRPDSPTRGMVSQVQLTQFNRRVMTIPIGVWHADHNIGGADVILINLPTRAYDHADPDKYRLPLGTDKIPFSFGNAPGW